MNIRKSITQGAVAVILSSTLLSGPHTAQAASQQVKRAVQQYHAAKEDYRPYLSSYSSRTDYINFSTAKSFPSFRFTFDQNGIPQTYYGSSLHYNPVTIAQAGLHYYGRYVEKDELSARGSFLKQADQLIKLQSPDGALRYDFSYRVTHMNYRLQPGWVSSMAQGQALSVYARAYHLTKNDKYKRAGKAALTFLLKDKKQGGSATTLASISQKYAKNIWFEEYVMPGKDIYTLNGYVFTILGLYDWSMVGGARDQYGQKLAERTFAQSLKSLKLILPKYDIGGFTSYDLSHLTYKQKPHVVVSYQKVHIYLMHTLYSVTGDSYFRAMENRFKSHIE